MFLFQSVEANTNLKYITQGSLKTSESEFNPEAAWIKIWLEVEDPEWQPKQGINKWNIRSRTFFEVSFITISQENSIYNCYFLNLVPWTNPMNVMCYKI